MNDDKVKRSIIDRDRLPALFPTHRHSPEFWEQLGRTIATYGFLEEVLGRAIFAFTGTRSYRADEIDAAFQAWLPQLEHALTDQLWNLAESYGKAAHENPATTTENVGELVEHIKKATVIRNVLCHGSWQTPNADGASLPLFVNRQKQVFDTAIDITYLKQVQAHVAELACCVIDSVTHIGWQFPGSAGPGKPIMQQAHSTEAFMGNEALEQKFHEAMFTIYQRAKDEAKYNATRFLDMITKDRVLMVAKMLINAPKVSDGYTELYMRERLDLTVEAEVVDHTVWHPLFDPTEIERARDRLRKYGYKFTPQVQSGLAR
jgi:hypothetical protein